MQIQVINDQEQDHATAEINRLKLAEFGSGNRTIFAEAYAICGLVDALEVRANRGEREILVLNCTDSQIRGVLGWQSWDEEEEFESLVIHLVRSA
jgi:hypothetical protein